MGVMTAKVTEVVKWTVSPGGGREVLGFRNFILVLHAQYGAPGSTSTSLIRGISKQLGPGYKSVRNLWREKIFQFLHDVTHTLECKIIFTTSGKKTFYPIRCFFSSTPSCNSSKYWSKLHINFTLLSYKAKWTILKEVLIFLSTFKKD